MPHRTIFQEYFEDFASSFFLGDHQRGSFPPKIHFKLKFRHNCEICIIANNATGSES